MHLGTNCCHMAKVLIPKIRTRRTLFQFFLPTNPWQQRASLDSVFCRASRVEKDIDSHSSLGVYMKI